MMKVIRYTRHDYCSEAGWGEEGVKGRIYCGGGVGYGMLQVAQERTPYNFPPNKGSSPYLQLRAFLKKDEHCNDTLWYYSRI